MQYPAIITAEGNYTLAEFPDCPGCQTFAREGEDIEGSAAEALEGWLEANLGRDSVPNRPGTVTTPKRAKVRQVDVPLILSFRLELRWARADARETQAEFGQMLGMTQQQYARLEGTRSNPTLDTVDRVARLAGLGVLVTRIQYAGPQYRTGAHRRMNVAERQPMYVVTKKSGSSSARKKSVATRKASR